MKLRHITLASLCLSAAMSGAVLFKACTTPGTSAGDMALLTIWALACVAGLLAEIVRRA